MPVADSALERRRPARGFQLQTMEACLPESLAYRSRALGALL